MSALLGWLLQATAVAAVALVLEVALRRWVSPAFLAALWTVALVRFLVPEGPAFRFSLSSALSRGQQLAFAPLELRGTSTETRDWLPVLAVGWVAVVLVLAARELLAARRLALAVRALPEASAELLASVRQAASTLGLREVPEVRVGAGPFVFGLTRPVLVVPTQSAAPAMLLHELAHLRRKDHWVRLLQLVAQVAFFFWPPVRWVNSKLDSYRELACDEAAVRHGSISPTGYARLLLALAPSTGLPALEMASPGLERRIDRLLASRGGRSLKLRTLGLVGWAMLALGGSALAIEEPEGPSQGTLDPSIIQTVIHEHRGEFRNCYDQALSRAPLAGKVVMGWRIGASGRARDVRVLTAEFRSPPNHGNEVQLQSCLVSGVAALTFTPPTGGEVELVYPFVFTSSEGE